MNALVDEALCRVGLTDTDRIRRAYPTELSGGMLQRVLHAHVRLLKPQILLADEPTSALDVTNRLRVLRHLKHLARETGMTVVMVTHDLALARAVANRIVVVERGRIAETIETDGMDGTDAFTDAQTPAGRALARPLRPNAGRRRRFWVRVPRAAPSRTLSPNLLPLLRRAVPHRRARRSSKSETSRSRSQGARGSKLIQ